MDGGNATRRTGGQSIPLPEFPLTPMEAELLHAFAALDDRDKGLLIAIAHAMAEA